MMTVVFVRHGKTAGNLERRYIGRTDEPLCGEGIREILERAPGYYPPAEAVYVSPKTRCLETAKLIWPERVPRVIPGLEECDFGEFEGKNYLELSGNAEYQRWIDSGGTRCFPGGEDPEEFKRRCREAFVKWAGRQRAAGTGRESASERADAAFVVHGGTIMSVFSAFAEEKKEYYDWQTGNGEGYLAELGIKDGLPVLHRIRRLTGGKMGDR